MVPDTELRKHLLDLLRGGQAHITFEKVVKDFPVDKAGIRPAGSPHSAWELLEHIRIAQEDIARFSGAMAEQPGVADQAPKSYVELDWPDDYWPKSPAPRNAEEWHKSIHAIRTDLAAFVRLLERPESDLFAVFPWGSGQTLLREALLIADHNAYHLGQLLLVRRMIEAD
jgi:DinB superfamily